MIDTICLESPEITEELASIIESFCIRRSATDLSTGEVQWEFTTGDLRNSADNRISIKVLREKWVKDVVSTDIVGSSYLPGKDKPFLTHKVSCGTYLRIEASVHKLMCGHNIFGGSSEFQKCAVWLIKQLESKLSVELPIWFLWKVLRVDVAEIYDMGSKEICFAWFEQMQNVNFPRRQMKASKHGLTGLYFPGISTTLKFYHKGTEFKTHDKSRLRKYLDDNNIEKLQKIADNIIRVELEVKSRKLKYDYGHLPFICELSDEYLSKLHDEAVLKVLNCVGDDIKMLNRAKDVERYLYGNFTGNLAGSLFGTWVRLSTLGEESTKQSMNLRTLQRHKKYLKESGISWLGTDVVITDSIVPIDFKPLRTDRHHFNVILSQVFEALKDIDNVVA